MALASIRAFKSLQEERVSLYRSFEEGFLAYLQVFPLLPLALLSLLTCRSFLVFFRVTMTISFRSHAIILTIPQSGGAESQLRNLQTSRSRNISSIQPNLSTHHRRKRGARHSSPRRWPEPLILVDVDVGMYLCRLSYSTMVENSREYRLKYWATRSSVRSLAPLTRSLTSLTPSLVGQWMNGWLFCVFFYFRP